MVAALYLPIVFLLFPVLVRSFVFPLLLIFGIFYVFPFLNKFRHSGLGSWEVDNWLFEGHFDSFQSYILVVNGDLITYGKQLFGAIFFFIPRSFWEGKPIGSGRLLAEENSLVWLNASANLYTEGYVNFGYFGVVLVALILGWVCAKLDVAFRYQFAQMTEKQSAVYTPLFLILIGSVFLFLRGDLLTAITSFFTFSVPLLTVHHIARKT